MPDEHTKAVLKTIADNPVLSSVLKEVLLSKLPQIPSVPDNIDDATLGQMVRARATGIKAINDAFVEIDKYKKREEREPLKNPAR